VGEGNHEYVVYVSVQPGSVCRCAAGLVLAVLCFVRVSMVLWAGVLSLIFQFYILVVIWVDLG